MHGMVESPPIGGRISYEIVMNTLLSSISHIKGKENLVVDALNQRQHIGTISQVQ